MPTFRFRAAAALDIRRRQEDEAAAILSRAEARLTAARDELTAARLRLDAAAAAYEAALRGGTSADTALWHRNWMVGLSAAASACAQQVSRLAAGVEAARRTWLAARQRRLMLERLRDRAWTRHRAAEHRHEMKQLDELARARFATPPAGTERSET